MASVTVAAFVPAELRPDHLVAAGTLTQAELPARDLGHGRLLLAACPSPQCHTPGSFLVSLAGSPREISGAGLVILAAPACGTGQRMATPLGWRAYRSAGSEQQPQPAKRSRCRARAAGRRAFSRTCSITQRDVIHRRSPRRPSTVQRTGLGSLSGGYARRCCGRAADRRWPDPACLARALCALCALWGCGQFA